MESKGKQALSEDLTITLFFIMRLKFGAWILYHDF